MTHTLRNELKYEIPYKDKNRLIERLSPILKRDPHSNEDGYMVKSLYFDDYSESALNDNLAGNQFRHKYRIRFYNANTSYICLEKKVKVLNKGYKDSVCITKNDVIKILNGSYEWMLNSQSSVLTELYTEIKNNGLRPKTIIVYQRIPYLFKAGNIRITLDFNIHSTNQIQHFLDTNQSFVPHTQDRCLLEVKYDSYLPDFIKQLIQLPQSNWISHSKYVQSRLIQQR
jgi:hypothetical protein